MTKLSTNSSLKKRIHIHRKYIEKRALISHEVSPTQYYFL